MMKADIQKHVAIIGGGPAGLFVMKQLVCSGRKDFRIAIFESRERLGAGMPYSSVGANREHVTNVSENELPELETTVSDWMGKLPAADLEAFDIDLPGFHAFKVLPRLLFGAYLSDQFELLLQEAAAAGIETEVFLKTTVEDIADVPDSNRVAVRPKDAPVLHFDYVVIATGHHWPKRNEGRIPGWFDSPYPPAKLEFEADHPVCIKGASLTAIDAMKTLARRNGRFIDKNEKRVFELSEKSPDFKLVLHSRSGLLPAVRFHLDEPGISSVTVVSQEEISAIRAENEGYIPLDFIFERNFKDLFKEKDPAFYERIRDWNMEEFVSNSMDLRERIDPFLLFKAEFAEAEKSINRRQSIHWKELLSELSFAMNYPAKYFSAEDMLRLQKTLMPLIAVIIASVPQSSAREMIALYEAGVLELKAVGTDNTFEAHAERGTIVKYTDEDGKKHTSHYRTFVDCSGQKHFPYAEFPFKSLCNDGSVSPARLKFRTPETALKMIEEDGDRVEEERGDYFLKVPGIMINDYFQVLDQYGALNERIYMMAVPYIGGYNPDYSGLDFCEAASERVAEAMVKSWGAQEG
jgi:uncharacterized NAD(P)/FAD-binding protein YdhS